MAGTKLGRIRLLQLLGNSNVLECLIEISNKEARFKDLSAVFPSERMRCIRLEEMVKLGIIERVGKKSRGKIISVYRITEDGKRVLNSAREIAEKKAKGG